MRTGSFRILAGLLSLAFVWAVTQEAFGGNLMRKASMLVAAFLFFAFAVFGHSPTFARIERFFFKVPSQDEPRDEVRENGGNGQ